MEVTEFEVEANPPHWTNFHFMHCDHRHSIHYAVTYRVMKSDQLLAAIGCINDSDINHYAMQLYIQIIHTKSCRL